MNQRIIIYRIISVCILTVAIPGLLIIGGCEDLLPDYEHPDNIFAAEFIRTDTDTLEFSEPRDGSGGAVATYTTYYVIFSYTNIYEETFQYPVNPKGTMMIEILSVMNGSSALTVTAAEIQSTNAYNVSTGMLTLNPGESIYFRMRIDPKLQNGFYLHKYASEKTSINMAGQSFLLKTYFPLSVTVRFTMQLAPDLPAVTTEKIISINLKGRFPYSP